MPIPIFLFPALILFMNAMQMWWTPVALATFAVHVKDDSHE